MTTYTVHTLSTYLSFTKIYLLWHFINVHTVIFAKNVSPLTRTSQITPKVQYVSPHTSGNCFHRFLIECNTSVMQYRPYTILGAFTLNVSFLYFFINFKLYFLLEAIRFRERRVRSLSNVYISSCIYFSIMADEKMKTILQELGIQSVIGDFESRCRERFFNCYVSYLNKIFSFNIIKT